MNAERLALVLSSAGHFLIHYFMAMYFTIVIVLTREWETSSYEDLIALWTPASIMIGALALPAGRLADRWSSAWMLVLMFVGMGTAAIACGFADSGLALMWLLALIGVFAAIYHPVGIPWLIRSSRHRTGLKLAVNGVFGGVGAAAAGGGTGLIIDAFGWQWAFFLPGIVCVLIGLAMWLLVAGGRIVDHRVDHAARSDVNGRGDLAAFLALMAPMFVVGLVYNATQSAMPKLFEEGMPNVLGGDIVSIGLAVTAVYAVGAAMQLAGGMLADRFPLKHVYLAGWLVQAPLLLAIVGLHEHPLFVIALLLVAVNTAVLPAENLMIARFAPAAHHGLAFGIKFVLAFGAAPLGIWLIKVTRESTGDFSLLFTGLAITAALVVPVVLLLPGRRRLRPA